MGQVAQLVKTEIERKIQHVLQDGYTISCTKNQITLIPPKNDTLSVQKQYSLKIDYADNSNKNYVFTIYIPKWKISIYKNRLAIETEDYKIIYQNPANANSDNVNFTIKTTFMHIEKANFNTEEKKMYHLSF